MSTSICEQCLQQAGHMEYFDPQDRKYILEKCLRCDSELKDAYQYSDNRQKVLILQVYKNITRLLLFLKKKYPRIFLELLNQEPLTPAQIRVALTEGLSMCPACQQMEKILYSYRLKPINGKAHNEKIQKALLAYFLVLNQLTSHIVERIKDFRNIDRSHRILLKMIYIKMHNLKKCESCKMVSLLGGLRK
jgi:hypothetical protein